MVNAFYEPQLNLTITCGSSRVQRALPLIGSTDWQEPDPNKDLYVVNPGEQLLRGAAGVQWRDLLTMAGGGRSAGLCRRQSARHVRQRGRRARGRGAAHPSQLDAGRAERR